MGPQWRSLPPRGIRRGGRRRHRCRLHCRRRLKHRTKCSSRRFLKYRAQVALQYQYRWVLRRRLSWLMLEFVEIFGPLATVGNGAALVDQAIGALVTSGPRLTSATNAVSSQPSGMMGRKWTSVHDQFGGKFLTSSWCKRGWYLRGGRHCCVADYARWSPQGAPRCIASQLTWALRCAGSGP